MCLVKPLILVDLLPIWGGLLKNVGIQSNIIQYVAIVMIVLTITNKDNLTTIAKIKVHSTTENQSCNLLKHTLVA